MRACIAGLLAACRTGSPAAAACGHGACPPVPARCSVPTPCVQASTPAPATPPRHPPPRRKWESYAKEEIRALRKQLEAQQAQQGGGGSS